MDDRFRDVGGVLGADHDVAELARPVRMTGTVDRERKDVGRGVAVAVVAVERANLLSVDERDREVSVLDTAGRKRGLCRPLGERRMIPFYLDLDRCDLGPRPQACLRACLIDGACCSACSE